MGARFDDDDYEDSYKNRQKHNHQKYRKPRKNNNTSGTEDSSDMKVTPFQNGHYSPLTTVSVKPFPNGSANSYKSPPLEVSAFVKIEDTTVKWYDANRGFGFVIDQTGRELYFHVSSLKAAGIAKVPVVGEPMKIVRGPNRNKPGDMVVKIIA